METPLTRFKSKACDAKPTTIPETEPSVSKGLGSRPTILSEDTVAMPTMSQDASELAGSKARRILAAVSACRSL